MKLNDLRDIAAMPTVDVIIPAYNAAKYLPVAIDSVVAQTFEDWRILLIDDGSTDDTAEVVAPYIVRLGSKLKYIRQANGGLPNARNAAIRNSSAEFLALLDADDIWLPNRLTESLKSFENRPQVGLSYGFNNRIDQDGAVIDTFNYRQKHGEGKIAPYIYMRSIHLPCPTVTFRRKCIDEVGMFDESLKASEDRDLWLRIGLRYEVALVPKVIAHYRTSPDSMSTDPDRMLKAQLQFIEKHYGAPGCGMLQRRIALGRAYKQRAEALGLRRKPLAALASSFRALAYYPFDLSSARTAGSLLLRGAGISR
jgi:cellulose synthase/poly-beta-1,6-N-acetylglucosamine synthase-like glycosyltransferase